MWKTISKNIKSRVWRSLEEFGKMNEKFWSFVYDDLLSFCDLSYSQSFDVALGLVIIIDEWWLDAEDGWIYQIVLSRCFIPLLEDEYSVLGE